MFFDDVQVLGDDTTKYPRILGEIPRAANLGFIYPEACELPQIATTLDASYTDDVVIRKMLKELSDLSQSDRFHTYTAVATQMFSEFDSWTIVFLSEHPGVGEGVAGNDCHLLVLESVGDLCQEDGVAIG